MIDNFSFRLLRAASVLVFFIVLLVFILSQLVTIAPQRVQVRDQNREIIGEASIPFDYGSSQILLFSLTIISGIQLWTVLTLRRMTSDHRIASGAEQDSDGNAEKPPGVERAS